MDKERTLGQAGPFPSPTLKLMGFQNRTLPSHQAFEQRTKTLIFAGFGEPGWGSDGTDGFDRVIEFDINRVGEGSGFGHLNVLCSCRYEFFR